MIIAGIDYSMTCPCVVIYDDSVELKFDNCKFYYQTDTLKYAEKFRHNIFGNLFSGYSSDEERYYQNAMWVMKIIEMYGAEFVMIEDYSFASRGKVFNLAENCGLMKHNLWMRKIPFDTVPPTTAKKFFSGKGNSDKEKMYESFVTQTGIDLKGEMSPNSMRIGSPVGDIVDAYAMIHYGNAKKPKK